MRVSGNEQKRKVFIVIATIILIMVVIATACAVYLGDYYRADQKAMQDFTALQKVSIEMLDDKITSFSSENPTKGFIFYPGGKVEASAYEPLMAACAEQGILCVLVEMPFNLAVFDVNAADGIQDKYPVIEEWYIGGHSLGGSMAASYLKDHAGDYKGLILLGSYSTADLSETNLDVLSIYGSEDGVINHEKYGECKVNLPTDFTEVVIDGGCHAYFGMYGAQEGDGTPVISNEEQIAVTVEHIIEIMK